MSSEAAFLAAIAANPAEDTPRLAFADWLDERGGEADRARAEFIRVQCELARLRYDDDRVSDLQARELRLLARHAGDWRGEGRFLVGFARGMVERWNYVRPEQLVAEGPDLFAHHPVRELDFSTDGDGWGGSVAGCPLLARVETLRLARPRSGRVGFPDFLAVLSSPHLTRLTTLDASGGHGTGGEYGDAALFELLGANGRPPRGRGVRRRGVASRAGEGPLPSLRGLRRLSLSEFGLTDRGLRLLLDSPLADTLTHLDLSRNGPAFGGGITAGGIRDLIASPLWGRLEALNLAATGPADEAALRELVAALPRSSVRVLGLTGFASGSPAAAATLFEALAAAESWGPVETLTLSGMSPGPDAVRALVRSPALAGLRRLHLGTFRAVNRAAARALANAPHAAGLTALVIADAAFNDAGMAELARSPHLSRLVYLDVSGTRVGDAGVAAFVRSPNAGRLRILAGAGFGDAALRAVADSPHLGRLTTLWLQGPTVGGAKLGPVTDAGAAAVGRSPNLPNLTILHRYWGGITDAGFRDLLARPGLVVHGWSAWAFETDEATVALREKCPGLGGFEPFPGYVPLPAFDWSKSVFE